MSNLVPEWFLSSFAVATVFTVMLNIGLDIVPREFLWAWQRPALMLRALFSVLIAVPVIALVIARVMDLPRAAEVGLVVMAISPGAPVALQRSLSAGGHRSFAPTLQITLALLAVVSMPLSVAALDEIYAAHATVAPGQLMRQVTIAQLLPLSLGVALARFLPGVAAWLKPKLDRAWRILLGTLAVLAVVGFWSVLIKAGPLVAVAASLTTIGALAVGHALGGPDPGTRTAVAISSAARNPGLALLAAALNSAPLAIKAVLLNYLVVSALTVLPYVLWRRRVE